MQHVCSIVHKDADLESSTDRTLLIAILAEDEVLGAEAGAAVKVSVFEPVPRLLPHLLACLADDEDAVCTVRRDEAADGLEGPRDDGCEEIVVAEHTRVLPVVPVPPPHMTFPKSIPMQSRTLRRPVAAPAMA